MPSNEDKVSALISDAVNKAFTAAVTEQEKKRTEAAAAAAAKKSDDPPATTPSFIDMIFGS